MNIVYGLIYPDYDPDEEIRDDIIQLNTLINNFLQKSFNAYNPKLYLIESYDDNICLLCGNVSCKKLHVNWRLCKNHLPSEHKNKKKTIFGMVCKSSNMNHDKYKKQISVLKKNWNEDVKKIFFDDISEDIDVHKQKVKNKYSDIIKNFIINERDLYKNRQGKFKDIKKLIDLKFSKEKQSRKTDDISKRLFGFQYLELANFFAEQFSKLEKFKSESTSSKSEFERKIVSKRKISAFIENFKKESKIILKKTNKVFSDEDKQPSLSKEDFLLLDDIKIQLNENSLKEYSYEDSLTPCERLNGERYPCIPTDFTSDPSNNDKCVCPDYVKKINQYYLLSEEEDESEVIDYFVIEIDLKNSNVSPSQIKNQIKIQNIVAEEIQLSPKVIYHRINKNDKALIIMDAIDHEFKPIGDFKMTFSSCSLNIKDISYNDLIGIGLESKHAFFWSQPYFDIKVKMFFLRNRVFFNIVAEFINRLHELNIFHRNLDMTNVWVNFHEDDYSVMFTDFSLAEIDESFNEHDNPYRKEFELNNFFNKMFHGNSIEILLKNGRENIVRNYFDMLADFVDKDCKTKFNYYY